MSTLYRVTLKTSGEVHRLTAEQLAAMPARNNVIPLRPVAPEAPALRFFYNGIKVGKGPLEGARYSLIKAWQSGQRLIPTQITIYHKEHCGRFSKDIGRAFEIENDTDSQTDYFDRDRIRVLPTHPIFFEVAAAMVKSIEKDIAHYEKRKTGGADGCRQRLAELAAVVDAARTGKGV